MYLCCAYDYDSNTIHAEPMKTKTGTELMTTYQSIQNLLSERGLTPKLHLLDNECPQVLKTFMNTVQESFQLVPPHIHRRNAAERAIQTFKDHFIAKIASCHKDFPLHLWCRLLPHALITLNLMRQSNMNPKLSAYAQLHGAFNYDATPLAPPGTKIIVHTKPKQRGSWACKGLSS